MSTFYYFIQLSALPDHIADLWLESIARGTMHVLCEEIIRIHELSSHGTKQLITDIGELIIFIRIFLRFRSSDILNSLIYKSGENFSKNGFLESN